MRPPIYIRYVQKWRVGVRWWIPTRPLRVSAILSSIPKRVSGSMVRTSRSMVYASIMTLVVWAPPWTRMPCIVSSPSWRRWAWTPSVLHITRQHRSCWICATPWDWSWWMSRLICGGARRHRTTMPASSRNGMKETCLIWCYATVTILVSWCGASVMRCWNSGRAPIMMSWPWNRPTFCSMRVVMLPRWPRTGSWVRTPCWPSIWRISSGSTTSRVPSLPAVMNQPRTTISSRAVWLISSVSTTTISGWRMSGRPPPTSPSSSARVCRPCRQEGIIRCLLMWLPGHPRNGTCLIPILRICARRTTICMHRGALPMRRPGMWWNITTS